MGCYFYTLIRRGEWGMCEHKTTLFDQVLDFMEVARPYLIGVEDDLFEALKYPREVLVLHLPVKMDDGSIKVFKAYRSHHNNALGPYKGGVRYHPEVTLEEVIGLSALMTWKCSVAGLPYGGGKGGIACDPKKMSAGELEKLSRAYALAIARFTGVDYDIPAPDVNTNPQVMAWFVDTYEKVKGWSEPGVYTGKPLIIGGSEGRGEATSLGGAYVTREAMKVFGVKEGATCAIQGYGNAGSFAHKLYSKLLGVKVVAISDSRGGVYNPKGIDYERAMKIKEETGSVVNYPEGDKVTNEELLELDVDILVPAALEGVINEENAPRIKARLVSELANGPVTPEANKILFDRGVICLPDILTNSGGVTVSYFEWVQNRMGFYWPVQKVHEELDRMMTNAFHRVYEAHKRFNIDLRTAAFVVAISRVAEATKVKGIWP